MTTNELRIRKSIDNLTDLEKDKLVIAWRGIQHREPKLDNSFFKLAGYHGEPFRGAGWGNSAYWGGYCNHGNVLFPTWHRVYLWQLENALRDVSGCADVTLPYWDETSGNSQQQGIPTLLTDQKYKFKSGVPEAGFPKGKSIDNPLYSYKLAKQIVDRLSPVPDANYSKPKNYETVRYPLSGLVGTPKDQEATKLHNEQYSAHAVERLNENIKIWLTGDPVVNHKKIARGHVVEQYRSCLTAPNYTVFSNTTSCTAWNDDNDSIYVSLESPHNNIHLAVGGFDLPNIGSFSPISGANGDMGENDTASFDPIFYFHHCFVDLVFWLWQNRNGAKSKLDIIPEYPGTNTVDNQGPTPGMPPNSWLSDTTPLEPFKKHDDTYYTSTDCVDITKLGYNYEYSGILSEPHEEPVATTNTTSSRAIYVTGLDRTKIKGSFLISTLAEVDGEQHHIGTEGVLSRWHVEGCANCQTHLRSSATFPLPAELAGFEDEAAGDRNVALTVQIRTHTRTQTFPIPTPTDGDVDTTHTHIADDGTETNFRAGVRSIAPEQPEGA